LGESESNQIQYLFSCIIGWCWIQIGFFLKKKKKN